MAVPFLHRTDCSLASGPLGRPTVLAAKRAGVDVVARVDGRRLLAGKSTLRSLPATGLGFRPRAPPVPGAAGLEVVPAVFAPGAIPAPVAEGGAHVVNARMVFDVLR